MILNYKQKSVSLKIMQVHVANYYLKKLHRKNVKLLFLHFPATVARRMFEEVFDLEFE